MSADLIRTASLAAVTLALGCALTASCWAGGTKLIVAPDSVGGSSIIQLNNVGNATGDVRISLLSSATGEELARKQTSVPAHGSISFTVDQIKGSANVEGAANYAVAVDGQFNGIVQQLLADGEGTLRASTAGCTSETAQGNRFVVHANTTAVSSHNSAILIHNVGGSSAMARLDVHDGTTGAFLGEWASGDVPVNATIEVNLAKIQDGIRFTPSPSQRYVNLVLRDGFDGFVQHVVTEKSSGAAVQVAGCYFDASNP